MDSLANIFPAPPPPLSQNRIQTKLINISYILSLSHTQTYFLVHLSHQCTQRCLFLAEEYWGGEKINWNHAESLHVEEDRCQLACDAQMELLTTGGATQQLTWRVHLVGTRCMCVHDKDVRYMEVCRQEVGFSVTDWPWLVQPCQCFLHPRGISEMLHYRVHVC